MGVTKEREVAVYALMDILSAGGYNNITLKKTLDRNNALPAVQKAFITEVTNGVLRNLIYIDYVIDCFSKTPVAKMKPFILNVLRLSVYQLTFMDKTPDYAVCSEAVALVKKKGFVNLAPFVNGVLRSISRGIMDIKLPDKDETPVDYLCKKYSFSQWIIEGWLEEFDFDTVQRICAASNSVPPITICVNTTKTTKEALVKRLKEEGIETSSSGNGANMLYISKTSDITKSNAFNEGLFHIMDESSMKAVEMLKPEKGDIIFDVCAAPGGKAFYCSYIMENTGVIYCGDVHEHKIKLINEGANRLGIDIIKTEIQDATVNAPEKNELADKIIIDAPCTGLGLLRKKPDIKYKKTASDVKALVEIQRKMLMACHSYVKPGGTLLYSTCTLSKQENMDNVEWFISKAPFELDEVKLYLPELGGRDGFFMARMIHV